MKATEEANLWPAIASSQPRNEDNIEREIALEICCTFLKQEVILPARIDWVPLF